jgi:hypothetical protein
MHRSPIIFNSNSVLNGRFERTLNRKWSAVEIVPFHQITKRWISWIRRFSNSDWQNIIVLRTSRGNLRREIQVFEVSLQLKSCCERQSRSKCSGGAWFFEFALLRPLVQLVTVLDRVRETETYVQPLHSNGQSVFIAQRMKLFSVVYIIPRSPGHSIDLSKLWTKLRLFHNRRDFLRTHVSQRLPFHCQ